MELTSTQIAEYNSSSAFATTRKNLAGLRAPTTENENPTKVTTNSAEDSMKLASGSLERLNSIQSNLNSMRELTEEASGDVTDERKKEIYALMRSLSAGVNELVTDSKFNDKNTLNGNPLYLSNGTNNGTVNLEVEDLSVWEDGLSIATRNDGAAIDLFESSGTHYLNANSNLEGLEFASAEYMKPASGFSELQNGDYKVEISYYGSDSSVILYNDDGVEIDRSEGVNLSGSGTTVVEMDSGIKFTIDKEQTSKYFDKTNYITDGPSSYYSDLTYQRVYTHDLSSGGDDGSAHDSDTELIFGNLPTVKGENGDLSLKEITTNPVSRGSELRSGVYTVQVDYRGDYKGDTSSVMLMDGNGVVVKAMTVDLSELGGADLHTIDFENGLSITIDSNDFDQKTGQLSTSFKYTAESEYYESFDYEAYTKTLDSALNVVSDQITQFQDAKTSLENIHSILSTVANGGNLSSVMLGSSATTASSLVNNSLDMSSSILKPLTSATTNSYLSFTSEAIKTSAASILSSVSNNTAGLMNALMIE